MATVSGTNLAGYTAQVASTEMFWTGTDAFAEDAALKETVVNVAEFLFDKGILGERTPSANFIGVEYPDGTTTGDPANAKLRYNPTFMKMVADGGL